MADALAAVASKVDRMEEQNSNADDQQRDRATFEEREEHWVEGHEEHDAGTQLTEESQQDVLVEEDSSAAAVDDDHGHDANPAEDGMQPLPDVRVLADVARGDHSPIPSPPDGGAHARKFSTTSSTYVRLFVCSFVRSFVRSCLRSRHVLIKFLRDLPLYSGGTSHPWNRALVAGGRGRDRVGIRGRHYATRNTRTTILIIISLCILPPCVRVRPCASMCVRVYVHVLTRARFRMNNYYYHGCLGTR